MGKGSVPSTDNIVTVWQNKETTKMIKIVLEV